MRVNDSSSILNEPSGIYAVIEASATVSAAGLMQASVLPADVDGDTVAALSAPMFSWGSKMARETQRGEVELVFVKGRSGCVLMNGAGNNTVLTVIARSCAGCRKAHNVSGCIPDCINVLLDNSVAA